MRETKKLNKGKAKTRRRRTGPRKGYGRAGGYGRGGRRERRRRRDTALNRQAGRESEDLFGGAAKTKVPRLA